MAIKLAKSKDGKFEIKTNPHADKILAQMKDEKLQNIFKMFSLVLPLMREQVFNVKSNCIGTSNIMIQTLKGLGYDAELLPVSAELWNKKLIKLVNKLARTNRIKDLGDFVKWVNKNRKEYDASGAHMVGLGDPGPKNVGHYCVYLPNENLMMDATIDQSSRPLKDMVLDTIILVEPTHEFMNERRGMGVFVHKCKVVYHRQEHTLYQTASDWLDESNVIKGNAEQLVKLFPIIRESL